MCRCLLSTVNNAGEKVLQGRGEKHSATEKRGEEQRGTEGQGQGSTSGQRQTGSLCICLPNDPRYKFLWISNDPILAGRETLVVNYPHFDHQSRYQLNVGISIKFPRRSKMTLD